MKKKEENKPNKKPNKNKEKKEKKAKNKKPRKESLFKDVSIEDLHRQLTFKDLVERDRKNFKRMHDLNSSNGTGSCENTHTLDRSNHTINSACKRSGSGIDRMSEKSEDNEEDWS